MTEALPFTKGQKIKLNAKGLRVYQGNRRGAHKPTNATDWQSRIGIIGSISKNGARVIWQGNKTKADILGLTCLEPA